MLTGQILLQLIVILIVVQIFGLICRRLGQQWVIGEIVAGLALGPSLLGWIWPGAEQALFPRSALPTLQTLGDIGLVLYMFALGARLDTNLMLRQSRIALVTSMSGILLPLLLGIGVAYLLFPAFAGPHATQVSFLLLIATVMAITAFPVLARFLTERKLLNTNIGTLALTSAAIDDITAWCLLALVVAVAQAHDPRSVLLTIGLTVVFIASMFLLVRPLLAWLDRHIHSKQFMGVVVIILLLSSAYATDMIGIHPVFGGFLMGIVLPRRPHQVELVRNIDQINTLLFLPLYFVCSGLNTQIGLISTPWLWVICGLIVLVACVGKISGGTFAVRVMGKSWREAMTLGVLMNTRGLVGLIVLNIGLETGVLAPTIFAMLVIMALLTTMIASPLLTLLGYKQGQTSEHSHNSDLPQEVQAEEIS